MHPRLEALETMLREEFTCKIQALEWANETLDQLGLMPAINQAAHLTAHPYYSDPGRMIACAYFHIDQKPEIMPILTSSQVENWKRSQFLAHDESVGRWAQRLYTDYDYYVNGHRITIRFVSPVKEGDAIGDCTVERIEQTGSRLAIACKAKS